MRASDPAGMEKSRTWRCSAKALLFARFASPALWIAAVASMLGALVGPWKLEEGFFYAVFFGVFATATYRFAIYPSLQARPEGLIVRNPLSTTVIPWDRIRRMSPGYSGIVIERQEGHAVRVWCVQKSNWAMARGNRTRADDVIDEIGVYRSDKMGHSPATFLQSNREKGETKRSARRAIIVGSAFLVIYVIALIISERG